MKIRKIVAFLLATTVIMGSCFTSFATEKKDVDKDVLQDVITNTAEFMYKTVKSPQVGSIGGEWAVLGLARSGYVVPDEYYQNYYNTVVEYVKACGGNLHPKKFTEYSRLIVALTSISKDPTNVGGYNLLTALGDYDKTIWQGLNGPIWALISLDSGNYEMPVNPDAKTQTTRDMYIDRILQCQLPDGGFSLFGGTAAASSGDGVSDADITGMALQALAKYDEREDVKIVIDQALECMSKKQNELGGYSSWNTDNSESCVQMLVALCELGIPIDDPRFVKNGNTMLDNLMTYYTKDKGFSHTKDGSGSNQMAAEQGFYGCIAAKRAMDGKNSLYNMSDSIKFAHAPEIVPNKIGLDGKNTDIAVKSITNVGRTFADIVAHKNQPAIEALASRGIINGVNDQNFEPNSLMTRAEFATVVVRGLGLKVKDTNVFTDTSLTAWYCPFTDISPTAWYCSYVDAAFNYGIVTGVTDSEFNPEGNITREEAATMVCRVAKLCGIDTALDDVAARDILAGFTDYMTVSPWAKIPLAVCYNEEILDKNDMEILPQNFSTRGEIAQMLFNLLGVAKLL